MIPDGDIKWLNQKTVEKQLGHSNLTQITTKYSKDLRKQRCELQGCDKQSNRLFMIGWFAIHIIMYTRTVAAVKLRKKLGFNQYDVIMAQENLFKQNLIDTLILKTKYFNAMFWDAELICIFQSINLLLKWMN